VQGEIMGPSVKFYEIADYLFWTLSDASVWLPDAVREMFVRGFGDWGVWMWTDDFTYEHPECPVTGALWEQVYRAQERRQAPRRLSAASREDLLIRARASSEIVGLPESGEELAERLLGSGVIEATALHRARERARRVATSD
jgi:hypothetical protein